MSSSDFRQITIKNEAQKAERLFRAAVSAFCSLTRPSRREIAQVDDLALPLFDLVSVESKRYVAAALSECPCPPVALIKRLCDESVDIAAPLLIRSPVLTDVDLIALIGRHGHGHARAIGRRPGLNPAIARLVAALENKVVPLRPRDAAPVPQPAMPSQEPADAGPVLEDPAPGTAVEDVRQRLRAMMRPASANFSATARTVYERLRETALSGHAPFFQTALADALDVEFAAIRDSAGQSSCAWLLDALRMLDVGDEKAFLVTAAIYPSQFGDLQAIRLFLSRYAAISREEATLRIARWKTGSEPEAPGLPPHADSDLSAEIRVAG
ncbi:DUF2336 domain-containing protein [Mesorhizobium sp. KR9-304]|uniref:DUF2336 domain-containing protein n=1 Tax=Mesorhizobium sp. KR9-304 TaxID=3156614 RepID=UPI0032B34BE4